MKAVDYLKRASNSNELIDAYNMELRELRKFSEKLSDIKFEITNGSNNHEIEELANNIIELENMIIDELSKYVGIKKEIYKVINKLEEPAEKALLIMRYVNFLKWETISYSMNYSEQHIFRIHKRALSNVEFVIRENRIM